MSYDFTGAKAALSGAFNVNGWADKKSARLECDYLIPLQHNTLRAEELSDEIEAFIFDIESKMSEITNDYDE